QTRFTRRTGSTSSTIRSASAVARARKSHRTRCRWSTPWYSLCPRARLPQASDPDQTERSKGGPKVSRLFSQDLFEHPEVAQRNPVVAGGGDARLHLAHTVHEVEANYDEPAAA